MTSIGAHTPVLKKVFSSQLAIQKRHILKVLLFSSLSPSNKQWRIERRRDFLPPIAINRVLTSILMTFETKVAARYSSCVVRESSCLFKKTIARRI